MEDVSNMTIFHYFNTPALQYSRTPHSIIIPLRAHTFFDFKTRFLMHPTIAEINLGAIRRNVARIAAKVAPAEVMAVVKADGYGHGAVQTALAALAGGATRLAVAHPAEGTVLRRAGIDVPIQVFGGFFSEQIEEFLSSALEFTVCDLGQAEALQRVARDWQQPIPVHVKFDTGMGRVGFPWEKAPEIFTAFQAVHGVKWLGLMTHFATADERDKTYALEQLERFHAVIEAANRQALKFHYLHAANSGAILDMPQACFNLVRPGVSMYGYYPSDETSESIPLEPAMRWISRLMQVKRVRPGQAVSYGASWSAERDTTIGTVAVGYADGYRRALSNRFYAVVGGRRVPVVGRVCMDFIMLDLGPEAIDKPGDEVVLLGAQGDARVPMRDFCEVLNTIPYEITCMVSRRVLRRYVEG